jgi:hypothetical protein
MVRAEPGVDAIRALRAWLKTGLRIYGLRCVGIQQQESVMDVKQFAAGPIKPDQVRDGPVVAKIINVYESEKYNVPVLELDNGDTFLLNATNTRILAKAWGFETEAWLGLEVEFSLGSYKDWRSDPPADKETVVVRAISPAKTAAGNSGTASKSPLPASIKSVAPRAQDLNDEIPFALAFFIVSTVTWLIAGGSILIA